MRLPVVGEHAWMLSFSAIVSTTCRGGVVVCVLPCDGVTLKSLNHFLSACCSTLHAQTGRFSMHYLNVICIFLVTSLNEVITCSDILCIPGDPIGCLAIVGRVGKKMMIWLVASCGHTLLPFLALSPLGYPWHSCLSRDADYIFLSIRMCVPHDLSLHLELLYIYVNPYYLVKYACA